MANFLESSNGGPHDRDLPGPIEYHFDNNGLCVLSINDILVVLDWDENTLVVKNRPILGGAIIKLGIFFGLNDFFMHELC
jgi:hypothetical protein